MWKKPSSSSKEGFVVDDINNPVGVNLDLDRWVIANIDWSGHYMLDCLNCGLAKHACVGAKSICWTCRRKIYYDPIFGAKILFEGEKNEQINPTC